HVLKVRIQVVRMGDRADVERQQRRLVVLQQFAERVVELQEAALQADHGHRDGGVQEGILEEPDLDPTRVVRQAAIADGEIWSTRHASCPPTFAGRVGASVFQFMKATRVARALAWVRQSVREPSSPTVLRFTPRRSELSRQEQPAGTEAREHLAQAGLIRSEEG